METQRLYSFVSPFDIHKISSFIFQNQAHILLFFRSTLQSCKFLISFCGYVVFFLVFLFSFAFSSGVGTVTWSVGGRFLFVLSTDKRSYLCSGPRTKEKTLFTRDNESDNSTSPRVTCTWQTFSLTIFIVTQGVKWLPFTCVEKIVSPFCLTFSPPHFSSSTHKHTTVLIVYNPYVLTQ